METDDRNTQIFDKFIIVELFVEQKYVLIIICL